MMPTPRFLLLVICDRDPLAPEHLADFGRTGLTVFTITTQKVTDSSRPRTQNAVRRRVIGVALS